MMKPYKKYKIIKNKIEKFQKIIYEWKKDLKGKLALVRMSIPILGIH
jgi:hypothetical protein